MARKKVTPNYITNDSDRKVCYRKRKKGLIKKVSELATLCDVEACCIIYSEYDPEGEVWPSRADAQAIMTRFKTLSEEDQGRKMVNQESFTYQRTKKAADKLRRLQKENKLQELENYMYQCISGARELDDTYLDDAAEMDWVINQVLRNIEARQEALREEFQRSKALLPPSSVEAPPIPPPAADVLVPPMEEENLQGFPWNLVQSPVAGAADGLEIGDFGWDPTMGQPYPYLNPSTSNQQGNQASSSNDFNDSINSNNFNYFNHFKN